MAKVLRLFHGRPGLQNQGGLAPKATTSVTALYCNAEKTYIIILFLEDGFFLKVQELALVSLRTNVCASPSTAPRQSLSPRAQAKCPLSLSSLLEVQAGESGRATRKHPASQGSHCPPRSHVLVFLPRMSIAHTAVLTPPQAPQPNRCWGSLSKQHFTAKE